MDLEDEKEEREDDRIFSLMVWSLMMERCNQIKDCRSVCEYE